MMGNPDDASARGAVYLFYGWEHPEWITMDTTDAHVTLLGDAPGDLAGLDLSGGGDTDGDGSDDVVIGAPGASDYAGLAYVVLGGKLPSSLELAGDADARLTGEKAQDHAGHAVAMGGDADGDGYDDILVGAHYAGDSMPESGRVYLLHGPVTGDVSLAQADTTYEGESSHDYAGVSLDFVPDVDGDGTDEVLIGAYYADHHDRREGAAYLVFGGGEAGLVGLGQADWKLGGSEENDYAGSAVAGVEDMDGDGAGELLIVSGLVTYIIYGSEL